MASWWFDGWLTGIPTGDLPKNDGYLFASDGVVDVNGQSRLQYNLNNSMWTGFTSFDPIMDRINAVARLTFTQQDVNEAVSENRRCSVTMFVVSHDAFSASGPNYVPSAYELLQQGPTYTKVYRGLTSWVVSGDRTIGVDGPRAGDLNPNTKYWVLLVPTKIKTSQTPSVNNDKPLSPSLSNARGLSIWTNRPPTKPVITSPTPGTVAPAGTVLSLSYVSLDADSVPGGDEQADRAGVQAQYAAVPTAENPNPVWSDLPMSNSDGSVLGVGHIVAGTVYDESNWGVTYLWTDTEIDLACGSNTVIPDSAHIPSGNWQIRLRTFDYGHPYPNFMRAFAATSTAVSALTAPAANTSPWSDPVRVSITARVPPPVPISPTSATALPLPAGQGITLTWQYRNTFSPPYPQKARTVQIRKTGEVGWTTLVSENSASSTFEVPLTYEFEVSTSYEWRVQVEDEGGDTSNYSTPAQFWIVPQPGSGSVRPVPLDTVDSATLGCGTHRVLIYRRGGQRRVGELRGLSLVTWGRLRDDISTARIVVSGWDEDCGALLARLQTWAYEVVIVRDNGYSQDRVWEGPITLLTYQQDKVVIQAKDVMAYAYRRIIKQAVNDSGTGRTVTARAAQILQNAFAPDDPNVLSYLQVLARSDDAMQYRSLPAYSRTAYEEIDEMAANAGLDYTAVGRAILLWGTKHRIGTLPEFRDKDLGSPPIVSEYGMSFANRYVVSDGTGIYGEATRLDAFDEDENYGLVEMLSSSWASDSPAESGTYTQEGIETIRESFRGYAEKSIADRYPPPVVVRVPDNTTLNPSLVLSIQSLVPGVVIPLRSTGTLRAVAASQKLDSLTVTEENGQETITIVMSPFSADDARIPEGGEE